MIKIICTAATALLLTGVAAPALAQSWMPDGQATPDWSGPYVGVYGSATQANDQDDERLRFDRNLDGNFGDTVVTAAGGAGDVCSDAGARRRRLQRERGGVVPVALPSSRRSLAPADLFLVGDIV